MNELWRHPEGLNFHVSSHGRIRNLDGSFRKGFFRNGYFFTTSGSGTAIRVHRVVAAEFIGPQPFPGAIVRHLDDDKTNNHVSNLAWGTHSENAYDRVRNGHHFRVESTTCVRGHPLSGPNLIQRDGGARGCRECANARNREYRLRKGITTGVGRGNKVKNPNFLSDMSDERHGTLNGYTNLKCRCRECQRAATEDQNARRARKRAVREALR